MGTYRRRKQMASAVNGGPQSPSVFLLIDLFPLLLRRHLRGRKKRRMSRKLVVLARQYSSYCARELSANASHWLLLQLLPMQQSVVGTDVRYCSATCRRQPGNRNNTFLGQLECADVEFVPITPRRQCFDLCPRGSCSDHLRSLWSTLCVRYIGLHRLHECRFSRVNFCHHACDILLKHQFCTQSVNVHTQIIFW